LVIEVFPREKEFWSSIYWLELNIGSPAGENERHVSSRPLGARCNRAILARGEGAGAGNSHVSKQPGEREEAEYRLRNHFTGGKNVKDT
jgi:hypothetical protein